MTMFSSEVLLDAKLVAALAASAAASAAATILMSTFTSKNPPAGGDPSPAAGATADPSGAVVIDHQVLSTPENCFANHLRTR